MDNNFLIVTREELVGVADAIREKGEISKELQWPEDYKAAIGELSSIPEDEYKDSDDVIISGLEVKVAAGYYEEEVIKNVQVVEQATPTIDINGSGLITAEVSQIEGYVEEGIKSNTKQLTTQVAKTITPTTSEQTAVNAGVYTTGAIKVSPIPSNYITTTDATATAGDILSGKTAYVNGSKVTGSIASKSSNDLSASGATVTVPAGYYASQATKSVATATQATPSISIDSAGKITASATQTAGYVAAGTKSGTKQMTVKAATTWTPKTTAQSIAAGTYLTGKQTIKGDANLVAANIREGVSIFGVSGGYSCAELNFTIVGGTSQPSSPAANTIWVNTRTTIKGWAFVNEDERPSSPASGMVAIIVSNQSNGSFTALKESTNILKVYPVKVLQYINKSWTTKEAKIYQNGAWVGWLLDNEFVRNGVLNSGMGLSGKLRSTQAISVTQSNGYVRVNATNNVTGGAMCAKLIDCSKYSTATLVCDVKTIGNTTSVSQVSGIGIFLSRNLGYGDVDSIKNGCVSYKNTESTGTQTLKLSLPSSGSYYIGIMLSNTIGGFSDVYVYDFYLS